MEHVLYLGVVYFCVEVMSLAGKVCVLSFGARRCRAVIGAQADQAELVRAHVTRFASLPNSKPRVLRAVAAEILTSALIWHASVNPVASPSQARCVGASASDTQGRQEMDRDCKWLVPPQESAPSSRATQRVAVDSVASPEECRTAMGATIVAMEGLPSQGGETTLEASEPGVLESWMGEGARRLVRGLCGRVR